MWGFEEQVLKEIWKSIKKCTHDVSYILYYTYMYNIIRQLVADTLYKFWLD